MRIAGKVLIAGIVSVLAGTALPGDSVLAQGRATGVMVDAVVEEPLNQTMPVLGRFVARQSGIVAALGGGPVSQVLVQVGDRVAKGDVLVRLDTGYPLGIRNLRLAEIGEKQAALETARAQVSVRTLEHVRLGKLKKSPAFSKGRYEDLEGELARLNSMVAQAEASVLRARANLELAEIELARAEIKAPYDGVVVLRHTTEGAYVNPGAPVVTLVNDKDLEIEVDVPSDRLAGLTPGREMAVRLDNGSGLRAVVRAVIPTENSLTRTRPVRLVPDFGGTPQAGLAADQSVTVLLPIGEARQVVSVHKDAVISRGGKSIVFAIVGDKAELRPVVLGEALGGRFEVLDGLVPGDIVVVRGNERLKPGATVRYKGMKPAAGDG